MSYSGDHFVVGGRRGKRLSVSVADSMHVRCEEPSRSHQKGPYTFFNGLQPLP